MLEKKIFINNDDVATFQCPECENQVTMDFSRYREFSEIVMLEHRCKCGHTSTVLLERRKFYRREVNISGTYVLRRESDIKGTMRVKNLSRGGLKFGLDAERELKVGDKVFVKFQLGDENNTWIKKDVFIRTILELDIGAEFCSKDSRNTIDRAYDKAITRYILQAKLT